LSSFVSFFDQKIFFLTFTQGCSTNECQSAKTVSTPAVCATAMTALLASKRRMVGEVYVAITPGCLLGESLGEEKGEWLIPELRTGDQDRCAADQQDFQDC